MAPERRATPAYLRLAAMLRAEIAAGAYRPGDRLPSESQLMLRQKVSRSVAKWAYTVLKADGLVEGRQGAGVFVRQPRRRVREADGLTLSSGAAEEFTSSSFSLGGHAPQLLRSEVVSVSGEIAERLRLPSGATVLCTSSRYSGDDGPLQLVTSWQPGLLSGLPAFDAAEATRSRERIIVRAATPYEIEALALPDRGAVVAIVRVRTVGGRPIETADIVLPSDRCELVYDLLVE